MPIPDLQSLAEFLQDKIAPYLPREQNASAALDAMDQATRGIPSPIQFADEAARYAVMPLAYRSTKLKDLMSKVLQNIDLSKLKGFRYQQEPASAGPISQGGREGIFFKIDTGIDIPDYNHIKTLPDMNEGGPNKVTANFEPKNPLVLHSSGNRNHGYRPTLSRLIGSKERGRILRSIERQANSVPIQDRDSSVAKAISRHTGESINKTRDLIGPGESAYDFKLADFLTHIKAQKSGYDSIIRNTFGTGNLDYVQLGPEVMQGAASRTTRRILDKIRRNQHRVKVDPRVHMEGEGYRIDKLFKSYIKDAETKEWINRYRSDLE